jgi:signal transduction histidine kinase
MSQYFSQEALYFIQLYMVATFSIVLTHALRGRITMAPLFAVVGIQIMLLWQMRQLGWWLDWHTLKIDAALLAFVPPLMLGLLDSYAMDGIRVARAYIAVMLLTALIAWAFAGFHSRLASEVPIPYVYYLSPLTHFVTIISLLLAGITTLISYDILRKINNQIAFLITPVATMTIFVLSKNSLEYGVEVGWHGFRQEWLEYLIFTLPCMLIATIYGFWAQSRQLLMPQHRLIDILRIWRITESNLSEMRADVMNAHKIISELQQLNNELSEAQRINRYQMNKSPLGIVLIDQNGKIEYANPAAKKIFDDLDKANSFFTKIQQGQDLPLKQMALQSTSAIVKLELAGQLERRCEIFAAYRYNARKEIVGYSLMIKDITRQIQQQRKQNIENKLKDIQNAGRVIAHDFSNLFLGMQGMLMQIEGTADKDDIILQQGLQTLKSALARGREMLRQLSSGNVISQPQLRRNELHALLQEAFNVTLKSAQDKNITLRLKNDLKVEIIVDGGQICRVITNLINNAIRATPEGGIIEICAQRHKDGINIQIIDNGIGLTEEQMSRIFEPGYSTKTEGQGGLGLAISRQIVEAHEGRLRLSKNQDDESGITANIWLPCTQKTEVRLEKNILLGLAPGEKSEEIMLAMEKAGSVITEACNQQEIDAMLEEESDWDVILTQFRITGPLGNQVTLIEIDLAQTRIKLMRGDEKVYQQIRKLISTNT